MTAENYFITGSTGLLGETFMPLLLGWAPAGTVFKLLVRDKRPWNNPNIKYIEGDITDEKAIQEGASGAGVIIHMAALSHARTAGQYLNVNTKGTENLLAAAQSAGIKRFIFISSRYADPSCGAYGLSKYKSEELIKNSGIPYLIVRFGELYGKQSVPGIEKLVKLVRKLPVVPYPDLPATFAPLSLSEASDILCGLVLNQSIVNTQYTLTGSVVYTIREMLKHIAGALGVKRVFLPIPGSIIKFIHDTGRAIGLPFDEDMISRLTGRKDDDISRAKQELGFNPVPFEQGARMYFLR